MSVIMGFPTTGSASLRNLRLVDVVDGRIRTGLAVHVRDGVISAITADDGSVADHPVLDLGDAYLAPGLINMHTHFSLSLPGAVGAEVEAMDAAALALYMADGARRTLHNGVTTVRCVAEKGHADFALRRAI